MNRLCITIAQGIAFGLLADPCIGIAWVVGCVLAEAELRERS